VTTSPGQSERMSIPEATRPAAVNLESIIRGEAEAMAAAILVDERAAMAAAYMSHRGGRSSRWRAVVLIIVGALALGFGLERIAGLWALVVEVGIMILTYGIILGFEEPLPGSADSAPEE
jgi:hypothetical protein